MSFYVIGLDIGTTSMKAVLFDQKGHVHKEEEAGYPSSHPKTSWVEQDPLQIEQAAIKTLRAIFTDSFIQQDKIVVVGISSAMHSLICVTEKGEPLSPVITWADSRSNVQADWLKNKAPNLYTNTGTPLHPMSPITKLLWMKENNYEAYQKADKFISIKEFLIKRWFGEDVVDYSIASATGLFDQQKLEWNEEALEVAGIKASQLFTPVPPTYSLKYMDPTISKQLGLTQSIPFVIGASDGPLANLGVGAIKHGETAITIGTSGAIRQFSEKPLETNKQQLFSYRFNKNLWITGGPSNNGANVLAWVKQLFSLEEKEISFDELNTFASKSTPGANRLLFLPYLQGERAPVWDSLSKGAFVGLHSTHTKNDMIQAAMEGVIFNIYQIGQGLQTSDEDLRLYANGGFARSKLWLSILADIYGKPIYLPTSHQSSAWGAAWVALYSLGEVASLEEIKQVVPMADPVQPNLENHRLYSQLFEVYQGLYTQLEQSSQQLNNLI